MLTKPLHYGRRLAITALILLSMIIPVSCRTYNLHSSTPPDFTTGGFLSADTFQVIIKESPDGRLQGLVERRESSFMKAKESIPTAVSQKLADYYFSYQDAAKNDKITEEIKKNRTSLNNLMKKFIAQGIIADEFYDDDETVNLVYRVHKKGLKSEIESIQPPF